MILDEHLACSYECGVECSYGGRSYDAHLQREGRGGAECQGRGVQGQGHVEGVLKQGRRHCHTTQHATVEPEIMKSNSSCK